MSKRLVLAVTAFVSLVLALSTVPAQAAGTINFSSSWKTSANGNGVAAAKVTGRYQSKYQFDYSGTITDVCTAKGKSYSTRTQGAVVVRTYYKRNNRYAQLKVNTYFSGESSASCASYSFSMGGVKAVKPIALVTIAACDFDKARSAMRDCVTKRAYNPLVK